MTDAEQRANDQLAARLNEQAIQELQLAIEKIQREYRGEELTLEAARALEFYEEELRMRRARRHAVPTPETVKGQLDRMWEIVSRLETDFAAMTVRVNGLDARLMDWFAAEAKARAEQAEAYTAEQAARRRNQILANAYRLVLLGFIGFYVVSQVM